MRSSNATNETGIIAWFAANHVAANLLMLLIIVAGLITASSIRKETNPEFVLDQIEVRVPYLGAAPQEVEEGVERLCFAVLADPKQSTAVGVELVDDRFGEDE